MEVMSREKKDGGVGRVQESSEEERSHMSMDLTKE